MLCVPYEIKDSLVPGAGKGLFSQAAIEAGRVITAPTAIDRTIPFQELQQDEDHPHADCSIRWFEDHCTIAPDWPDECYVNHSFTPNGLWHLGFIFALRAIELGEEITVDYRFLVGPGVRMPFLDSLTGQPIIGFSWEESLLRSSEAVYQVARSVSKKTTLASIRGSRKAAGAKPGQAEVSPVQEDSMPVQARSSAGQGKKSRVDVT